MEIKSGHISPTMSLKKLTSNEEDDTSTSKRLQMTRSLKTFFMKLRGTSQTHQENHAENHNESLFTPSINDNNNKHQAHSLHSKLIITNEVMLDNYQFPIIENTNHLRRHRHTLDFSKMIINCHELGVPEQPMNHVMRRANSLCNNSIYSPNDELSPSSLSSFSSSTISSNSSSSYYTPPCRTMKSKNSTKLTLDTNQLNENGCIRLQQRLWNEDTTLCPKNEIAEYLGSNSTLKSRVLHLYMNNFDFTDQKLDSAFRILCAKVYFKAESQQLDRILEAFARRYFECNPTCIYHSIDVVHAVAYSLLLLNTDLHVLGDWSTKMTKSKFIKNTMDTIQSITNIRRRCASLVSVDENSPTTTISFFQHDEDSPISSGSSLSSYGGVIDALRSRKNTSNSRKNWLMEIESILKDMYVAVKSSSIDQADIQDDISLNRSKTLPKKYEENSFHKAPVMDDMMDDFFNTRQVAQLKEDMYKQGFVMRKHVLESTDKRARHRQWQLCYLVITENEMIMYNAIEENERGKRRKSTGFWSNHSFTSLQDVMQHQPYWQPDREQTPLATLKMNHTYAAAIPPPGWNPQRPHVFRLETADGGLWLFESTDLFAVQAWVEACNYTASKISKSSLPGAVCNIDYGWGAQCDNPTDVPVWYPPSPCMIDSTLAIKEQYQDIASQIVDLKQQLEDHRASKLFVDKKLTYGYEGYVNSTQALSNWDKKLHYLLHELIKLECYKNSLENSLLSY